MINPAIVVIAYNRDLSLKRLLNSLDKADYTSSASASDSAAGTGIPLIISIDKSNNAKVAEVANSFNWKYGEKKVITHEENLGLKKHVLSCGDYVDEYENIIVLEDDLYVSKGFYTYAIKALEFSEAKPSIAGVSLYNHCFNVHVREPFEAIDDGYDNYYMQFAQSWGQAYSKAQWHAFKDWLNENESKSVESDNVPANVSSWSDKSWLKYFIKYVIDADKFFIYPRISYTTNFGDEGTHEDSAVTEFQVSLAATPIRDYNFSTPEESASVYDAFFENMKLKLQDVSVDCTATLGNIEIDLYGYKPVTSRYILSSKSLPFKVIKSYGRKLHPIDANIMYDIEGSDLFLYDTECKDAAPTVLNASRILYNYKALSVKKMLEVIKFRLLKK